MKTRTKIGICTLTGLLVAYLGLVEIQSIWDAHQRRRKDSELADMLNKEKAVVRFKVYNPPPAGLVSEGTFRPGMYYLVQNSLYETNNSNLAELVLGEDLTISVINGGIVRIPHGGDPYDSPECNPLIQSAEWQSKITITTEDALNEQGYWVKIDKGDKEKYYGLRLEGIRARNVDIVIRYYDGPTITFYPGGGIKVERNKK